MAETPSGAPLGQRLTLHRVLRQLRAIFVAFHVLAVSFDAMPSPASGMNRLAWKERTVQQEFAAWAGRLGQEPAVFEERLWSFAQGFMTIRRAMMTPFRPYLDLTGTQQSWQMFVAPHRWPTRLQIQISADPKPPRMDRSWETLFEERSAVYTWHASFFDRERVRASVFRWGWPGYSEPYANGCQALAEQVFAERADVFAVRCRFSRTKSPSPAEVRDQVPTRREWVYARTVERP